MREALFKTSVIPYKTNDWRLEVDYFKGLVVLFTERFYTINCVKNEQGVYP